MFEVPSEQNRINVTVGNLQSNPVVVGPQDIHTGAVVAYSALITDSQIQSYSSWVCT